MIITFFCKTLYSPNTGLLDQAHEHLKEAAYLFGRVSDNLHHEACYCQSLLARVAFLQGKTSEVGSAAQLIKLCWKADVEYILILNWTQVF